MTADDISMYAVGWGAARGTRVTLTGVRARCPYHEIQAGDCVSSIAYAHGLPVSLVWEAPENAGLRELCESPDLLIPGEQLFVPERRLHREPCADGSLHRFRRKDVPKVFRIQMTTPQGPIADMPYECTVDGLQTSGTTDSAGWIEVPIAPDAERVTIEMADYGSFDFELGDLDPVDTISGVCQRLTNLGYYQGEPATRMTEALADALARFEKANGLEVSGEVSDPTRDALVTQCGH